MRACIGGSSAEKSHQHSSSSSNECARSSFCSGSRKSVHAPLAKKRPTRASEIREKARHPMAEISNPSALRKKRKTTCELSLSDSQGRRALKMSFESLKGSDIQSPNGPPKCSEIRNKFKRTKNKFKRDPEHRVSKEQSPTSSNQPSEHSLTDRESRSTSSVCYRVRVPPRSCYSRPPLADCRPLAFPTVTVCALETELSVERIERAVHAVEAVPQLFLGDDERRRGVQVRRAEETVDPFVKARLLERSERRVLWP